MAQPTLSSQELPLGCRILGVNEACGMDLDFVEVNAVAADVHEHLQSVAGRMVAVGAREVEGVRPMLL